MYHLKRFLVKVMHVLMNWSHLGNKLRYQLSCPNMASTRSTTPTNCAQPNKSLHLRNENCVGGKYNKLRLTGWTAANAVGEKFPLFVIGKSKKSRCLKHIKHLPCRYRSLKKSWMDSILFEEWVREVDRRFTRKGWKIVLLDDNCPAHPPMISSLWMILSPALSR